MEMHKIIICPICKGIGMMISNTEHERMKSNNWTDDIIGLLTCIRKFDATCNINYSIFEHISRLNDLICNTTNISQDFAKFYIENPDKKINK